MGKCDHFVQFYEDDRFLAECVAGFLAEGVKAGEGALIIVTGAHLELIGEEFLRRGIDRGAAERTGQLVALDAVETLARFMIGGQPDWNLFHSTVGAVVRKANARWPHLRAFGEMVAVLWDEGKSDAAIRLEEFWNALAKEQVFALFCAYPMRGFQRAADGSALAHICNSHTRIIPAESYNGNESWDERLLSIALLQQKASALEFEVAGRQQAEATASHERAKLGLAASAAELGVWEYNLITRELTASDQCKAHFGLTPAQALGFESALSLIDGEDQARVRSALEDAMSSDGPYSVEFRVPRQGTNARWIAAIGRVVRNGSHHMLGITMDVTARKVATEHLEKAVALRTEQLRESLAELEAFSYSISHDMRAPLRAMQGYAESLIADYGQSIDQEGVDRLQKIQRASLRLDSLVREVLAYTRIAKGSVSLAPISLGEVIADILAQYPPGTQACITVEGPLHSVIGNDACLIQCLGNFVSNALKFTAPGVPAEVTIWSELTENRVKVSVRDRGIGIHPDHHSRVFQMFGRVYSDKTYEGTGMGMAIAKKAVARMGGEIGFHSEFGAGSTFWFTAPNGGDSR